MTNSTYLKHAYWSDSVLVVSIIRVSMTAELSQKLDKTWFYATLVAW